MDGFDVADLTDDERAALTETERGLEWVHRAHGALVEFHQAIGRSMDHFDEAERRLRGEHDALADRVDRAVLPAGVTADGKLTYELVAEFEDGFLETVEATADRTFADLADGRRYPIERDAREGPPDGDR